MIRALRAALFAAIVRSDHSGRAGCAGRADSSDHNVREPVTALWAILSAPVFPRPACAAVVALEVGGLGLNQPGAEEVGEIPIRVIKPCLLCMHLDLF